MMRNNPLLTMICTELGYAIVDAHGKSLLELSITEGQPIFHARYRSPLMPEVESIYLRGVVAGYQAVSK